ncbi:MAG: dockerin type I repeat-containing protein [Acutalibacteraceae bacterium]
MKKIRMSLISRCLALCMIATVIPGFSIPAGATPGANEGIYYVNQNTDGVTDNVIVADYNGVSYVMGPVSEDGTAAAIPAVKRDSGGNVVVVDETSAELFKVTTEMYQYSGGSYWLYRFITDNGYIVDNYGNDYTEHKLVTMDKETVDAAEDKPYYNWRFDWSLGWYNRDSAYSIYLVAEGENLYFKLGYGSAPDGAEYTSVKVFGKGCQHENMQYVPAVSPTCKKDGNGEYWYCPDCDNDGYSPYFSDADGVEASFNPPVTMSYGAIDENHDGVCDDCGKNMPEFKKVTDDSQIVAGGKYILVTQADGKYYAAATGTEQFGNTLPAVEITPTAEGNFAFTDTTSAMMIELLFANACTEWGNGIRYGFVTKFDGRRSEFAPMGYGEFMFDEYDVFGAKYGFYVGLDSTGCAVVHSAYEETNLARSYTYDGVQQFTFTDYSESEAYTESPVYLYRLTDTGTVNNYTYDMTSVKSETDYTLVSETTFDAEGGTNVTGITDAITQTAVNETVKTFVTDNSIPQNENVDIAVSVNVEVVSYSEGESMTVNLEPTANVSSCGISETYIIPDICFDGTTSMDVTVFVGDIEVDEVVHEKEDGTTETFYPEYSEEVQENGEESFQMLYDNDGNAYVSFDVTEYSTVRISAAPKAIQGSAETVVDYENNLIYTCAENKENIADIVTFSESAYATVVASYTYNEVELYGTGTVVSVYDGRSYVGDYTLIVEGDLNGDSVCDVIDCAQAELASNSFLTLEGAYVNAADTNMDGVVNVDDYQAIVNKAVS